MNLPERQELIQYLKHGDRKIIADAAGVHINTLQRWLKGKLTNSSVQPFFKSMAEARKAEFEKNSNSIVN